MDARIFRSAMPSDAKRCFDVETTAYDGDEAATLKTISKRIAEYPEGFLVLEVDKEIAGFINSGCAYDVEMSNEDFKELIGHDSTAPNVVIMSVVVDPAYQGQGLSTALMSEFVERMTNANKEIIHLMCKEHHIPLYEKFGYRYIQPSASAHGGIQWHEMMMNLSKA
ncbi:GNAT family N-acetyltransferase [Ruegeria arenilitoris]|uniref:GNAT family N-acetyltransferase n=1 Tax=Ruegeria arenilitoris TaxID=1173585 RepID=UPI00148093BB|nr:GNAT family N-acetyltransferase [Ruegeria arenilitoris]